MAIQDPSTDDPQPDPGAMPSPPKTPNIWKRSVRFVTFGVAFKPALPESIEGLITQVRWRAYDLTVFATLSVFGAIAVLIGGLYVFFVMSPALAKRDIEIRKSVEQTEEELGVIYKKLREKNTSIEEQVQKIYLAQDTFNYERGRFDSFEYTTYRNFFRGSSWRNVVKKKKIWTPLGDAEWSKPPSTEDLHTSAECILIFNIQGGFQGGFQGSALSLSFYL